MAELHIRYSKDAIKFLSESILAWDPDFTKSTEEEKQQMENAEKSGFVDESEIDWDNIGLDN